MNKCRIFSHMLVVAAVVFAGQVRAKGFGEDFIEDHPNLSFKVMGAVIAAEVCEEDDDAKKALIESLGIFFGKQTKRIKPIHHMMGDELVVFGGELATNYTIRKTQRMLRERGCGLDYVAGKVDFLQEGKTRDIVNPVARGIAEFLTHPEMVKYIGYQIFKAFTSVGKKDLK